MGFITQELTAEEKVEAMKYLQQFGWLAFKENAISVEEMPQEDAEDKEKKPSKRLRAVLYVYHQQHNGKKEEFEAFYKQQMEKIIDQIKNQLD